MSRISLLAEQYYRPLPDGFATSCHLRPRHHLPLLRSCLLVWVREPVSAFGILDERTFHSSLGAISLKKTKLTSFFMAFVVGQILFSLSAGILGLYFLYNRTASRAWNTANCSTTSDSFQTTLCRNSALMKGIATALIVVAWLVQFGMSSMRC